MVIRKLVIIGSRPHLFTNTSSCVVFQCWWKILATLPLQEWWLLVNLLKDAFHFYQSQTYRKEYYTFCSIVIVVASYFPLHQVHKSLITSGTCHCVNTAQSVWEYTWGVSITIPRSGCIYSSRMYFWHENGSLSQEYVPLEDCVFPMYFNNKVWIS